MNRDLVSPDRYQEFLGEQVRRLQAEVPRRKRFLEDMSVGPTGELVLPRSVPDSDEALRDLSYALFALYRILTKFVGDSRAKDRISAGILAFQTGQPGVLAEARLEGFLPRPGTLTTPVPGGPGTVSEDGSGDRLENLLQRPAQAPSERAAVVRAPARPAAPPASVREVVGWAGVPVRRGETLLLEGPADVPVHLGLLFLRDAIQAGEQAIIISHWPLDRLYFELEEAGLSYDELVDRLIILDWYSFKDRGIGSGPAVERRTDTIEEQGNLLTLPGPAEYLSIGVQRAIQKLDPARTARALITVLTYGLGFIDIETMVNFLQTSKLRFRKQGIAAFVTFNPAHHSRDDVGSVERAFPSRLVVRGTPDVKAPAARIELTARTPDFSGTATVVWTATATALGAGTPGPPASTPADDAERGRLLERIARWTEQGYDTETLDAVRSAGLRELTRAVADTEIRIARIRRQRELLDTLDRRGFEQELAALEMLLRQPEEVEELERRVQAIQARITERRAARDAELRERETFRLRIEHWKRQGYKTAALEAILLEDLETVKSAFQLFRQGVAKAEEYAQTLQAFRGKLGADELQGLRECLWDVDRHGELEMRLEELRSTPAPSSVPSFPAPAAPSARAAGAPAPHAAGAATSLGRRGRLLQTLFGWAVQGFALEEIERLDAARLDDRLLERKIDDLRGRIDRLQIVASQLDALDCSGYRDQETKLRRRLKDVTAVDAVEAEVAALGAAVAATGRAVLPPPVAAAGLPKRTREIDDLWSRLKGRLTSPADDAGHRTSG